MEIKEPKTKIVRISSDLDKVLRKLSEMFDVSYVKATSIVAEIFEQEILNGLLTEGVLKEKNEESQRRNKSSIL